MATTEHENIRTTILSAYDHLLEVFGDGSADGGNCGMAALAICEFCRHAGIGDLRIAFLVENIDGRDTPRSDDLRWIVAEEALLYHVVIDAGEAGLFDVTGRIDEAYLREMARLQYRDRDPLIIRGIDPKNMHAAQAISWETSWELPAPAMFQILSGKLEGGRLRLYHGTTAENADALLRDGFDPGRRITGANGGRPGHLYLTDTPDNAGWYAGDGVVLEVRVPLEALMVDPEDGIEASVAEEILSYQGLPANLATASPLPADAFSRPAPATPEPADGPTP